ncbi:hypothetical protein OS493_009236 [Desmophyllum pertusum]|uniref:Pentraxin (PTX) domain-containing protein n=1 Tax=Desmophyllum pertusum TaxID=174260 RepID=A0A9W9Z2Q2_9CNID|nr:hypothetical protein OS493_009236 [Desmophyllum pertusum]
MLFLDREVSLISLNDGKWRQVCLTWSSAAGAWNLYLDGALRGNGSSLGTGLSIRGGGRLVLGQDQANSGLSSHQSFSSAKSFTGNISQFNLWDQVIEQPTIKNMSRYCYGNQSIGNVVIWSEFQMKINGQAQMGSQSLCNITAEESRFILNFPTVTMDNAVVVNLSMPSLTAGTICWWMKNAMNNYNVFSYVAPGELNPALEVYFGTSWRLHLFVKSQKLFYDGPPLADSYWHHLCTDWNSSSTVWHVYLDGVLQLTQTQKHIKDYTIQGGGVFHLGRLVEDGAYHPVKCFQGMITGFNIWTKTLSARAVAALAREPGTESGDAIAWSMLREGIMGSVEISYNNHVQLTAWESDYTLNFSMKSNNSYVSYNYASVVMKAFSACAWIKTTAWSGELTIFSYSNEVHVTAIVWSIIDGNTIQMNVNAWDPR